MNSRLLGKVAIVTGAGQGIGRGIALRLAREGADIVVAERNAETAGKVAAEIERLGRRALPHPVDISDTGAVRKMVENAVETFGAIHILVNNAALVQTKPMMALSEADWDRLAQVNQRGMFFCLQAVAAQMIRQIPQSMRDPRAGASRTGVEADGQADPAAVCHGKIVNVSSVAGRHGRPLCTHYAVSKAAVNSVTRSAAVALAPYGINVNAIAPGVVPTDMWHEKDEVYGKLFDVTPERLLADFVKTVPLRRAATTEDMAGAVAFFCSSDADYITGQILSVDGGYGLE